MNKVINISIRNKVSSVDKDDYYICGNDDFIIRFDLDDDWDGVGAKTARFSYEGKFQDVEFIGNECPVPYIIGTHHIDVGIYGDEMASTPIRVRAKESILCLNSPDDEGSSVYEQVMQHLQDRDNPHEVSAEQIGFDSEGYATTDYVDDKIGDISAALDGLHDYATSLIGGEA